VDLAEIQSLNLETIISDKVKRAYEALKTAVIVEDVSAGLDNLGGLPGPFIKFFEKQLGRDALYQLAPAKNSPVTVRCAVAYYDGTTLLTATSEIHGTAVASRGEHGFGFDQNFQPAGSMKTYGELDPVEKDTISHRAEAIVKLADKIAQQIS
jgi:inosine triphosphate pyrophosphatase